MIRLMCLLGMIAGMVHPIQAEEKKSEPLGPVEAREKVGVKISLRMEVKTAKDRLEKRGEIYLDADLDFKSKENFAVVITRDGAASLKASGIDDPAEYFKNHTIHVEGTVKVVDDVPRIEIEAAKQIRRIDKK